MDLKDAVSYHQLVLASEGRTLATQRQYMHFERVFLRFLDQRQMLPVLEALNTATVREALVWYQAQESRQRTRGGEVAGAVFVDIMHTFARFLEREGIFTDDPLRALRRVKVTKRLRQPFTQAEVIGLWGACRQSATPIRDEALFLLLLDTGMRIGEACTISLASLRLEQRLIVIGGDAKGRQERLVPIGVMDRRDGGRTMRALRQYLNSRSDTDRGGRRLFLGKDGYPLEAPGGSQAIERLGKVASVANVGPHRLRHTFATEYLTLYAGDEIGLCRIIGHVSKEVLASYVHMSQSVIAQRAGRSSLAERWLSEEHRDPVPIHGRGNVQAWHCNLCQRRAAHTHK